MAINLTKMISLLLIFIFFSCKGNVKKDGKKDVKINNSKVINDTTNFNETLFELVSVNGQNELKIKPNIYKVKGEIVLKSPLFFLRYPSEYGNKVVSQTYPKISVDKIILIGGENGIQPIILKKDSIIYTDYYFYTEGEEKYKYAPDEKLYYQFAHKNN